MANWVRHALIWLTALGWAVVLEKMGSWAHPDAVYWGAFALIGVTLCAVAPWGSKW